MVSFIRIEFGRIGADTNLTPREVIRDFIELLNITYQNPQINVKELLQSDAFSYAKSELQSDDAIDENFAEFEI